jgi:hypothetical protein
MTLFVKHTGIQVKEFFSVYRGGFKKNCLPLGEILATDPAISSSVDGRILSTPVHAENGILLVMGVMKGRIMNVGRVISICTVTRRAGSNMRGNLRT